MHHRNYCILKTIAKTGQVLRTEEYERGPLLNSRKPCTSIYKSSQRFYCNPARALALISLPLCNFVFAKVASREAAARFAANRRPCTAASASVSPRRSGIAYRRVASTGVCRRKKSARERATETIRPIDELSRRRPTIRVR